MLLMVIVGIKKKMDTIKNIILSERKARLNELTRGLNPIQKKLVKNKLLAELMYYFSLVLFGIQEMMEVFIAGTIAIVLLSY